MRFGTGGPDVKTRQGWGAPLGVFASGVFDLVLAGGGGAPSKAGSNDLAGLPHRR